MTNAHSDSVAGVALSAAADSVRAPATPPRTRRDPTPTVAPHPFVATPIELASRRRQTVARFVLMGMAFALVVPVVLILVDLFIKAWPILSVSFLMDNPAKRMTAGGIWAPLIGTFCLVFLSLILAAPIGILAGVYLNEYAPDNWLRRSINLAVVNLAGVPSIVHGRFGAGAFVYYPHMNPSRLAAPCTWAAMT